MRIRGGRLAKQQRPPRVQHALFLIFVSRHDDGGENARPRFFARSAVRRAVASVDPSLPIYDVLTLDERIDAALSRPRFNATLVAAFAITALLIAALGVYGMLSYSVSCRRREIGIRLAIGAAPPSIVRVILGEGLRLALAGVVAGLAFAIAAGRITRSLVVDVNPSDPRILAAVAVTMFGVACLAAFLPARRASAVDPIVVLRQE